MISSSLALLTCAILANMAQAQIVVGIGRPGCSKGLSRCHQITATYTCPRGGILFSITPGVDRVGRISLVGHANIRGCSLTTSGRHYQLFIPIINHAKPPCGIKRLPNGNFGATFITQALPNLYTTIDRKYDVNCQLGQELSVESLPVTVTGSVLHGNVMQQTSEVILEIRDIAATQKQTSLALGQLAILYMYLPDTTVLKGMDIDSCSAYHKKNGESITLFENGSDTKCGTNTIFPADQGFTQAQGKPTSHMVSPAFEMFRFIPSTKVIIECTFTRFCTIENDQDCTMSCPYKFNSTRVRRSANRKNIAKIVTQSPIDDRMPSRATHTTVQVFNEDYLASVTDGDTVSPANVTENPSMKPKVCMDRTWFVLTLATMGSLILTLAIVCAICCYKIRKQRSSVGPTKSAVPPQVQNSIY